MYRPHSTKPSIPYSPPPCPKSDALFMENRWSYGDLKPLYAQNAKHETRARFSAPEPRTSTHLFIYPSRNLFLTMIFAVRSRPCFMPRPFDGCVSSGHFVVCSMRMGCSPPTPYRRALSQFYERMTRLRTPRQRYATW